VLEAAMPDPRPLRDVLRVEPGRRVRLADVDPRETHGYAKDEAPERLERDLERLHELQERLWAEHRHKVLVVLQGIDTAGKGGTIEHVVGAMNPAGVAVASFKVPTEPELAHDYLWRVHQRTPGAGEIAVFDRSHYEDVLVVRVHDLVPKARWSKRYRQIADWERMLAEEGTTILKFFLWIDREEQAERLRARFEDPTKRWKFRTGDLEERKRWDDYVAAFEDAISKTSTDDAPWFIVPANRKWFRNMAVAQILADTLEALDPQYPVPEDLPATLEIPS
jgi:PPK2 family polyphosphate:nucleotide phosphotransferase